MNARPYGGVSLEDRRAKRREQLMDAGLRVLGTEGAVHATVQEVARTAGLNTRYFYENFSTLDELMVAVFDRAIEGAIEAAQAAIGEVAGPEDQIREVIRAVIVASTEDPYVARILFVEALGSEALVRRRMRATFQFADLINALAGAPKRSVLGEFVAGGMVETIVSWQQGQLEAEQAAVVRSCADLAVAVVRAWPESDVPR